MQGKWSNFKNFGLEERKQSKNHCSPVKLESKKNNDKKITNPGRDRVGNFHRASRKSHDPSSFRVEQIRIQPSPIRGGMSNSQNRLYGQ